MTHTVTDAPLFGLGIAGNFAGHLTQTGEAKGLSQAIDDEKPQALFAFYVPNGQENYLTINPYSSDILTIPTKKDAKVQMEAEVAVVADVEYQDDVVTGITPRSMRLFNDATYRNAEVEKLAQKKNWGEASKGIGSQSLPLSGFDPKSGLNAYRFCSFHCRDDNWYLCCQDASITDYSYFYQSVIDWLIDTINQQQSEGALHNIYALLANAGYPKQVLISLGASRYTELGEQHHLKAGDKICMVLYHQDKMDFETIQTCVERGSFSILERDALVLLQDCVNPS